LKKPIVSSKTFQTGTRGPEWETAKKGAQGGYSEKKNSFLGRRSHFERGKEVPSGRKVRGKSGQGGTGEKGGRVFRTDFVFGKKGRMGGRNPLKIGKKFRREKD